MSRRCVRRYRYRTATAFGRSGGLSSGSVQEKMLRPVSWVAAVYLMITAGMRVGDLSFLPPQEATDELQGDG